MSKVQLIALDVDRTLLDSSLRLSDANRDAIRRATQSGIACVLCSGRSLSEIRDIVCLLPEIRYLVCENGASVYDLKYECSIYSDTIPTSEIRYILGRMRTEHVLLQCYHDNQSYFFGAAETIPFEEFCLGDYRETLLKSSVCDERLFDDYDTRPFGIEKINLIFTNEADRARIFNILSERAVLPVYGMRHIVEVSAQNADKGRGLRRLCEHLRIPVANSVAVGDSDNDASALRAAGIAVAMGNASEGIKAIADIVCEDCDHDGVAHLIDRFLTEENA